MSPWVGRKCVVSAEWKSTHSRTKIARTKMSSQQRNTARGRQRPETRQETEEEILAHRLGPQCKTHACHRQRNVSHSDKGKNPPILMLANGSRSQETAVSSVVEQTGLANIISTAGVRLTRARLVGEAPKPRLPRRRILRVDIRYSGISRVPNGVGIIPAKS